MIFRDTAPAYWAAGLPVIPLRPKQKMPAPNAWQSFASIMPTAETQAQWLDAYPDGNIGLPLGPQSGMLALDLDSDDPKVAQVIDSILPPTPWVRFGKKGSVRMFKFNGERTTRIKGEDGSTIVEILSRGTQVVLPPSIHPDTQKPYTANCELLSVADKLLPLPRDFEVVLRQALIDAGVKLSARGSVQVTKWTPAGGRDSALTAMAGLLARGVIKGERTLLEACNEAEAWVVGFTENVPDDPMDPKKASQKVMEFLRRDITEQGRVLPSGWEAGMADDEIVECRKYFGEELEEWSLEDYLTFLEGKFKEIPRDNQGARAAVIDDCLNRIAKTQHLNEVQKEMVLQYIQNGNGRLITMASMRKRIKELSAGTMEGNDHTEIAQHLLKEMERYGELRFDSSDFWQWAGAHWRVMHPTAILKVLAEEFGHLPAARKNSDHKGILNTLQNLVPQGLTTMAVPGINFANGYLTLDMELKEHDPGYGARYVLPYRYAPNEGAPVRLFALLDQAWGEDEDYVQKVQALREAIAVTLFGMAPRFSRAICLFGVPRSGKSTLKDVVQGMVPHESACSVPPHDWAHPFFPTQMVGKLVNFCGELSETELIAGDRFKSIVEGEIMNGQFKGKDVFKFRPLCAHWFASNHLPRTRDTSEGFNRRWLFLHFTRAVDDGQKIIGLAHDILAEEREAIAAWAVPAIQDLMRQQEFTLPASHKALISEVATQNNSVRHFLMAGGVQVHAPSADVEVPACISEDILYGHYYAFCKINSHAAPVALKRFGLILRELQNEIGFRHRIERSPRGEAVFYDYLTVAK